VPFRLEPMRPTDGGVTLADMPDHRTSGQALPLRGCIVAGEVGSVNRCNSVPSSGQSGTHSVENLPSRWKHSERRERTTVDYRFAVHEHLVFTVVAAEHLNFGL
jgi:hypothetical protein